MLAGRLGQPAPSHSEEVLEAVPLSELPPARHELAVASAEARGRREREAEARGRSRRCGCRRGRGWRRRRRRFLLDGPSVGNVRVALAHVSLAGRPLLELLRLPDLDVADRDACAHGAAADGAEHLGQGVPVLKVLGVLLERHDPVCQLLCHDLVPMLSLEDNIVAAVEGPPAGLRLLLGQLPPHGPFDELGGTDKSLALVDNACPNTSRGRLRGRAYGEDRSHLLLAVMLLCGARLNAAEPVDSKPAAVLGRLVEERRGGAQHSLQQQGGVLVVGAGVQEAALGTSQRSAPIDLQGVCPRGREEGPGVVHGEPCAEEVLPPLPTHGLLRLQELAQTGGVGEAGAGRREPVALLPPVRQVRVEDALVHGLVLCLERRGITAGQARPELAPQRQGTLGEASGLGWALRLGQVELVQAEIHTLGNPHGLLSGKERGLEHSVLQAQGLPVHGHGGQAQAVEAKVNAAVDAAHLGSDPLAHVLELAALDVDLGVAAVVPQLRHGGQVRLGFQLQLCGEPRFLRADLAVHDDLG
mmetsp:Transcript_51009/g.152551  ORF Transcript_51009/g.152551 Transcript_51009/m.152551 type:complete len:529 (+) Transcript_51009:330-1916(+)